MIQDFILGVVRWTFSFIVAFVEFIAKSLVFVALAIATIFVAIFYPFFKKKDGNKFTNSWYNYATKWEFPLATKVWDSYQ